MNLNLLFDMESLDWADMSIDKSDCLDKIQEVIGEVQLKKRDGKSSELHELYKPESFDGLDFDQLFDSFTLKALNAEWFIPYAYSTFSQIYSLRLTPQSADNLDDLKAEFPNACNALLGCQSDTKAVVYDVNSYKRVQLEWIESQKVPFDPEAFLKNGQIFQDIGKQYDGKTIYKHIETGQHWYLDNFHKQKQSPRHFEVFNSTGKKHIGEADLDGNLDTSKADKTKKLYL